MPTRATSLQNSTLTGLTREVGSKYDEIKLVADNIDAIEAVADAMAAGVDFEDIAAVTVNVNALELAMDGKVDKETGKSLMTDAERTKLQSIAQQATKNQADVYLLDRGNHTGTQSADTLTDGVVNVAMTVEERSKLGAVEAGANNYVHPSKHAVSVLDGSGQADKIIRTDGTGTVSWGSLTWGEIAGKPTGYVPAAHDHDMSEITTGNISASRVGQTTDRNFVTAVQLAKVETAESTANKGVPYGYAPLDGTGKINASYISDLNLMDVFAPVDQASMLALSAAKPGDVAYRQDTEDTYMLLALPASTLGNWKKINIGASVVSINGLTGVVSLGTDAVAEGTVNKYYTDERVDDRVGQLLVAGTNVSLNYNDTAGTLTINANDASVDWSELQSKPTTVAGYAITDAYVKSEVYTKVETNGIVSAHTARTDNPHNVTAGQLGLANYVRADKDLAGRNIAAMMYTNGNLTKIQYDTATDVNYEVLGYTSGNLTTINHYIGAALRGTTTLSYTAGNLTSAVFVGV